MPARLALRHIRPSQARRLKKRCKNRRQNPTRRKNRLKNRFKNRLMSGLWLTNRLSQTNLARRKSRP
jgi:hypothetical protein